jgi:hypothetical protein
LAGTPAVEKNLLNDIKKNQHENWKALENFKHFHTGEILLKITQKSLDIFQSFAHFHSMEILRGKPKRF